MTNELVELHIEVNNMFTYLVILVFLICLLQILLVIVGISFHECFVIVSAWIGVCRGWTHKDADALQ